MTGICSAAEYRQRATTRDGTKQVGSLQSNGGRVQFVCRDNGSTVEFDQLRRIDFDSPKTSRAVTGPMREFVLRTGERFYGELQGLEQGRLRVLARAAIEIDAPLDAFAQIRLPQNEVEIPIDVEVASSTNSTMHYSLSESLNEGYLCTLVRDRSERIELFSSENERVLEVSYSPDAASYEVKSNLDEFEWFHVQRIDGARRLCVEIASGKLTVCIDNSLLATARWASDGIREIKVTTREELPIKGTFARKYVTARPSRQTDIAQDVLVMANSAELYGTLKAIGETEVLLDGQFDTVAAPWSQVNGVLLARRELKPVIVEGAYARITFTRSPRDRCVAPEALCALIRGATNSHLRINHPLLGTMQVPLAEIARIEPLFVGRRLLISSDVHHMGDELREDFRFPMAEGIELYREFELDAVPASQTYISLDVAEMEPSAADTPPGTPLLSDLRRNAFVTELRLNDQLLGAVNSHVRFRRSVNDPQRVRVEVPKELLKAGPNSLSIAQRPSLREPLWYDDLELGPIAIEIE